ncbi:hypothetical protein FQR65_LT03025 [Abscondita terminalis]|nr:hypothetical protein FQR65_LT03025 [Abscondita terminalis]
MISETIMANVTEIVVIVVAASTIYVLCRWWCTVACKRSSRLSRSSSTEDMSCCGLLKKIRKTYDDPRGRVISVSPLTIPNQVYPGIYQSDSYSNGVFPGHFSPPPYLEYMEPPPKYEELIKNHQISTNMSLNSEINRNSSSPLASNNNNNNV